MPRANDEEIIAAEREVLGALCQETLPDSARIEILRLLSAYAFSHPLHRVLFEALSEARSHEAHPLGQQLLVRLTAKGFPDVDLTRFIRPPACEAEKALALARRLIAGGEKSSSSQES